ncbi:MAG: porin [Advenella sp.]|nr:porin [Advenella sp.]
MNKKYLIAVFMAAALPCAASATSVTLYGVLDVNFSHFSQEGSRSTGLNSGGLGGSRFGLRGVEKLNEDLDVIFTLEGGFDLNTGESSQGKRLFGRQSFVGLKSKTYGTVTAGRLQGLGYRFSGEFDPMMIAPGSVMGSLTGEVPRAWMYNPLGDPARMDNAILYVSPKISSFEFGYQHGFRGVDRVPGVRNKRFDLASLTYDDGALRVSYGFGHSAATTNNSPGTSRQTEHALGVRYKFSWATLFGSYQIRKTHGYSGTDRAWQVGARVPVSDAGAVHMAYGRVNNKTPFSNAPNTDDYGVRTWAVGYVHTLSKRTILYSYFKQLNNRGNSRQTIFPPSGMPSPDRLNAKVTAFGVGIHHRF